MAETKITALMLFITDLQHCFVSCTASELLSLQFKRIGKGLIQIESKDEAKRRGIASPNRAEAVMLARGHGGRKLGDYGITV